MEKAIARIADMERCFDTLRGAGAERIRTDAAMQKLLADLVDYYENGLWLHDYELDEQGLLPSTLKRGVLSQDAVYDFMDDLNTEEEHHEV